MDGCCVRNSMFTEQDGEPRAGCGLCVLMRDFLIERLRFPSHVRTSFGSLLSAFLALS
jgi:hypothetical protein